MSFWWHCNPVLSEVILPWTFLSLLLFRESWLNPAEYTGSRPKTDTVDLTFTISNRNIPAPVLGSTHTASWPSQFTGEESSPALPNPSRQLLTPSAPYPIRWEKQKTPFFPQDVFTWKGCLAGWWAMELVCQSREEADLSFTFLWEVPEWKAESDQFKIGTVTWHTRLNLSEK